MILALPLIAAFLEVSVIATILGVLLRRLRGVHYYKKCWIAIFSLALVWCAIGTFFACLSARMVIQASDWGGMVLPLLLSAVVYFLPAIGILGGTLFATPIKASSKATWPRYALPVVTAIIVGVEIQAIAGPIYLHRKSIVAQGKRDAVRAEWEAVGAMVDVNPKTMAVYSIRYKHIKGDRLKPIEAETSVYSLDLSGTDANDKDLESIRHLRQISYLNLDNTEITDAGLENLPGEYFLETISLKNTSITDQGVLKLKYLKNLEVLRIENTKITDESVEELLSFPQLRRLGVFGCSLTDHAKARLAEKYGDGWMLK